MKPDSTFRSLVLVAILMPLLVLSGCSDSNNNNGGGGAAGAVIFPAVNPAFDSIDEVAVSADPAGPYDTELVEGTDYAYDSDTESITRDGSVDTGGEYVRIIGMATLTGMQNIYTVYTYLASSGVQVAANELTSAAVGLVASGDAADFEEALGLVEQEFGLSAGSAADPVAASQRPAELTSVMSAAAPAFAGTEPEFDVTSFTSLDLTDSQAAYMDCVALGGMAYDSWHKLGAGGNGLPTDEDDADYTRCKACHGWDQQGTEGGYVRRDRNAGRANAGYQDPNNCDLPGADPATCTPSRNISTDATFGRDSAIEIPGGGRTWAEGSTVFDMVDPDWGSGAILGNRHPDLSAAEGPTAEQLSCLSAFLNAPEARADQVFAAMDTEPADGEDLAIYTPVATANAAAGETYYADNCETCHGDPSDDGIPDVGGLIAYLNGDGKFSEFMHKVHWGIPDTSMSRAAMGDPTAADVADLVAWMQEIPFMELSAAQVVPAVAGITARGSGTYTLTEAGLEYSITAANTGSLSGPITVAHFHTGRVGTSGGPVHTIEFTDGLALGIWGITDEVDPLTQALQDDLLAGNIYVNIHTDANPSGEIRGQVMAVQGEGNQAPTADIAVAPDITVAPDTLVTLDGSGSSDTDGPSALTYSWTLDAPVGSSATLSDPAATNPTFTADVVGIYTATLTVNDGLAEDMAEVMVTASTGNLPPVANAGPDQAVDTDSLVTLDGSGSSDPDTDPPSLTYAWSLDVPAGSTATLSDPTAVGPTFTADLAGDYTASLIVNDGTDDSPSDSVIVTATTPNVPPVANAGPDQAVDTDSLVTLDGSGSSDPDTDPPSLTYAWTLDTVPGGSTATLANANTASPTFTPDLDGTYTASLVVNDGTDDSPSDSVSVTATTAAVGDFNDGMVYYEFACSGCHKAGTYDTTGFASDVAGTGNLIINEISTLDPSMGGLADLTDQQVLDLKAFLDDPSIQP